MKIISISQPSASLIVNGVKDVENRVVDAISRAF
jgi:hypothetical protein